MSINIEQQYEEVAHILANMHTYSKQKFTMNDLIMSEKKFHDAISIYNISMNKSRIILEKFGINSPEYADTLNTTLKFSNMKDEAEYNYETIKQSLRNKK